MASALSDEDPGQDAQDVDQDQVAEQPAAPEGRGWTGWAISGLLHAGALLLMWGIYWAVKVPVEETPPLRMLSPVAEQPKPPKHPPTDPVPHPEIPIEVPPTTEPDVITVTEPTIEPDSVESPNPDPSPEGKTDSALTDSETGSQGVWSAIGAFANDRGSQLGPGGGKRRNHHVPGPTHDSESSVNAALRWFKRHQSPNGCWDPIHYAANCSDSPKCDPGVVNHGTADGATAAMTGYALLCYLAAGYDHLTPNHFKKVVAHGLEYLVSIQHPDGALGDRNYENAIAATALCEAYGMTGDPALKGPAQHAIDTILARENTDPATTGDTAYTRGLGWDYGAPSDRNDSSVTGWNVMALKSAYIAGLNVGHGMENARHWLDTVWKKQNPDWQHLDPYTGESRFPYTYTGSTGATDIAPAPGPNQPSSQEHDLTCVGLVCAAFLGHHQGDPMLESLQRYVDHHQLPQHWPCNTYYLYYNTLGMFEAEPHPQQLGTSWRRWNGVVRDMLVHAQRHDGCFDGSWDSAGTQFPGNEVGRVLSTAYCTLSLEVYYRYAHVTRDPTVKETF